MSTLFRAWRRFWFEPAPTSTVAVLRIGYGVLMTAVAISLGPDVKTFFSPSGVVPEQPRFDWYVGLLGFFNSEAAVVGLYVVFLVGAVCLAVGFHSRLAAVAVFVGILSFERRNPYVFNAGDSLLRVLGFYMMLAPTGAALSVDRWRRARDRFWEFPERAPWVVRLIQIQISMIYLSTVWEKVRGTNWNDGTAVGYALRVEELVRLRVPEVIIDSLAVINLLTWGTLAVELAMAILVWNGKLRPWVMAFGLALHLSIELTMTVGFFSLMMFAIYPAFVPPEVMSRAILAARGRVRRRPPDASEPPDPAAKFAEAAGPPAPLEEVLEAVPAGERRMDVADGNGAPALAREDGSVQKSSPRS